MARIDDLIRDKNGKPRLALLGGLLIPLCSFLILTEHWRSPEDKSYILGGALSVEAFGVFGIALGVVTLIVALVRKFRGR